MYQTRVRRTTESYMVDTPRSPSAPLLPHYYYSYVRWQRRVMSRASREATARAGLMSSGQVHLRPLRPQHLLLPVGHRRLQIGLPGCVAQTAPFHSMNPIRGGPVRTPRTKSRNQVGCLVLSVCLMRSAYCRHRRCIFTRIPGATNIKKAAEGVGGIPICFYTCTTHHP